VSAWARERGMSWKACKDTKARAKKRVRKR